MIRALARDPFWVPPSEVARMTDAVMWETYLRPAMEERRRSAADSARPDVERLPDGCVLSGDGRVLSTEEFLRDLAGIGLFGRAHVEQTIAKVRGE